MEFISQDRRLIERFRQGDGVAFESLIARHRDRMFSLVYRMTGERAWAEEIVADAITDAFYSLPRFRHESKFETWLHKLTLRVCLNHIRERKERAELELPMHGEATVASAAEAAISNCTAEHITAAMQDLPEPNRAAVILFHLEERSYPEIARILGISVGTAKSRVFRGTRQLRDRLREEGLVAGSSEEGEEVA